MYLQYINHKSIINKIKCNVTNTAIKKIKIIFIKNVGDSIETGVYVFIIYKRNFNHRNYINDVMAFYYTLLQFIFIFCVDTHNFF